MSPECFKKETLAAAAEGRLPRNVVMPWQTVGDTLARLQIVAMIRTAMKSSGAPVTHFKLADYSHYLSTLSVIAECMVYLTAATRKDYTKLISGPAVLLQLELLKPTLQSVIISLAALARQAEVYATSGGNYVAVDLPPPPKLRGLKLEASKAEQQQWEKA
eukprot:11931-Heterococcus_DN1.PRE.3